MCLRLGDDDPQIARQAHLEVVLAEEPLLGQLRFRHGRWAGQSVSELVSDLARNPAITVPLSTAVELAFSGCVDHRVLGRATRSSVCDAAGGGFVEGVEEAPCVGLDHACGRGYFDEVRGCCDINTSVEGAVCDAPLGTGACGATGDCEPGVSATATNVYAWTEVLPAHSAPPRIADWSDGEAVMVRVGEVWDTRALTIDEIGGIQDSMYGWARFEPSPLVSSVVMARVGLHLHGADGVLASHEREGTVSLYLHEIQAEADLRQVSEVHAIIGPIDELAYLGADGQSVPAGATMTVPCQALLRDESGAEEEPTEGVYSCRVSIDGYVRVSGPGLTGFLLPGGTRGIDVRPAGRMGRTGAAVRRSASPSVAIEVCTPIGSTRSCGCGTRTQRCLPGGGSLGVWGPCTGTEVCNNCDDDSDGNVDEGTATGECNDGLGCTADGCGSLFPGAPRQCINLPTPALCRRGACTVGVCAGWTAGTTPSQPTQRTRGATPWPGNTGCQWRESDNWCETQWDRCNCNGMARCDGTGVAPWSGTVPPTTVPSYLGTSLAACKDRPPVGLQSEVGDVPGTVLVLCSTDSQCATNQICNAGACQNLRNGGCENNRDVCSVERLCIEPSPATSMCRRFDPSTPLGPALRAAQVQLATMGATSGTIDGLAVSCSTLTPPSPYNRFCQTDGLPCTLPHDPTSISCDRLGVCGAQTPAGASDQVGDIVGAQWSGTGFTPITANDCRFAIESFPNSCYQERCGAGTGQCAGLESDTQCNTLVATNALGNPSCGGPFDCYGLVSSPGPLDPAIVSAGQTIGGFQGCRRVGACSVGGACFPAGSDYEQCVQCDPTANSNALLSRSFGYCGFQPNGLAPERCSQCGIGASCNPRVPTPTLCDLGG